MGKLTDRASLVQAREVLKKEIESNKCRILICAGTGCVAGGSGEIYERMCELVEGHPGIEVKFEDHVDHGDGDIAVRKSGCHGFCEIGPLLKIEPQDILYTKVKLEDCEEIFHKTIVGGELIPRLLVQQDGTEVAKQDEINFYKKQNRNVLKNCGHIDAEHIEEYLAIGGYKALEKVLFDMEPQAVIDEVSKAGLRGRGGAGFPTGKKWARLQARRSRNVTWYVTVTKETLAHSWTEASWKATLTR